MNHSFKLLGTVLALGASLLSGCSDDNNNNAAAAATAATETTLSGSIVKGPVNGGTVTVTSLSGTLLGTTTTAADGSYSLKISSGGDVVVEVKGGSYVDEATSQTVTLNQLKAITTLTGGAQTVHVTPLTYLAYYYAGNTVAGFNTALTNVATQFGLSNTNLLTTLPVVSSVATSNNYGRVLRAVSQYVATAKTTTPSFNFDQFMNLAGTAASFNASLQANFATAFSAINGGQTLTFSFNGAGMTIAGTGAGGGSGTCGVSVAGSVTTQGFTVPVNYNYCINGIAASSCAAGNSSVSQALSGQAGLIGGVNLAYTYSPSCAPGAITITLAP